MDRRLREFLTIVAFLVGFICFSRWQEYQYQEAIIEKDQELEFIRSTLIPLYEDIDSIQTLRDEIDTTTYNLSADSLERIFTERFGDYLKEGS